MSRKKKKSAKKSKQTVCSDPHALYEAAVQNPIEAVTTMRKIFRKQRHRLPHRLREDFCGTAAIAAEWVLKNRRNTAWGIDLDERALEWGRKYNLNTIGEAQSRVHLMCSDVLDVTEPLMDIINASNFSYSVFHTREALRRYFERVHVSLVDDGMFICDVFGGTEAMMSNIEKRRIPASRRRDGTRVPAFTYIWEHEHFDVISHRILCHIHFKLKGRKIREAYTYDWRLWTLPELCELLAEAGFSACQVYIHGWTKQGESDDRFRLRKKYENAEGWIAYVVGLK